MRNSLIIFAKAPLPGKVMTRLGKSIGMRQASAIYKRMLYRLIGRLVAGHDYSIELWCSPDTKHPFFRKCSREFDIDLKSQHGSGLGERMMNAFRESARESAKTILIGSDIIAMDVSDIELTINHLDSCDVVLMPTFDGGYGMIAMKNTSPHLFMNMEWSTPGVLNKTVARVSRLGLDYRLLDTRRDVDTHKDYIAMSRAAYISTTFVMG